MTTIITDNDGKARSEAVVLAAYFRLPNQSMKDFQAELKALSPVAKTELALGSARELGWTVTEVAAA